MTSTGTSREQTCPTCNRARSEWRTANSTGYTKGGTTYCCEGCATGGHCTCVLMQTAPRLERNTDETVPE